MASKRKMVSDFITTNYNIRYNTVINCVEIKKRKDEEYKQVSDRLLHQLASEIDKAGKYNDPSIMIIDSVLKSDLAKDYDPFVTYFESLPQQKTEKAAIETFARFITVKQTEGVTIPTQEVVIESLKRWAVASVANCYELDNCKNQTCFVLIGTQGTFKTTYLNLLCPPVLNEYLFCGKIDIHKNESLRMLAEKFIINLDDQLRSLNKLDADTVKTLISHGTVSVRLSYQKYIFSWVYKRP
jgi:predicted P-loop ATPase